MTNGNCNAVFIVTALMSAICGTSQVALAQQRNQPRVDPAVIQAEQSRIAAIAKAKRPAVAVFNPDGKGGGSGVVVTPDGYALTNYHVVEPCGTFMRCGMSDGKLYDAVLVGIDPTGDVALIKLLGRDDFPVAELADSDNVRVGNWCFAIGNPFLLATDFQPTVTFGIVSGVHRYQYPSGTLLEYADCIQTDASINPGNSGGPLFNGKGQLIGINGRGSFEKRGRVNVGVGYAISINQIKHFMGYLRSGRIVDHATLGATVTSDESGRVAVSNILSQSDAFRRGIRYDDAIISFGGRSIDTVNDFKNVLGIYPKGWRVPIVYERDGNRFEASVRLAGVHASGALIEKIQGAGDLEKPGKEIPIPGKQPDGKPEKGKPQPHPKKAAREIPAAAQKMITRRRGYANYYFNQLNQDRLWSRWVAQIDQEKLNRNWKMSVAIDGNKFDIVVTDAMAGGKFPGGVEMIEMQSGATGQLAPADSGGLLIAMNLWRRFLINGPKNYGDVYYLGRLPLPASGQVHDVIVATRDVVETHFYFDSETGLPLAIEMFPDIAIDPCELHLSDYRLVEGCALPFSINVTHAGRAFATIHVEKFEFLQEKTR